MLNPPRIIAYALSLTLLAACQPPASRRQSANPTVLADCRAETDRVYAAQNRVDLSLRDERNEPFAGQYVSGIVTNGLSARYARDNMVDSCIRANGGPAQVPDTGAAPAFSPGGSHP